MNSSSKKQQKSALNFSTRLNQLGFRLFSNSLPRLMSWWALKLWSRTQRFAPSAREKRMQLRASECSLQLNGREINKGYQVICFDAPAHGQTAGKQTHLLEIRDAIIALSERYGPFHAAIAHSFGVACLSAAINSGVSIASVIAISSPGGLSNLIQRYCQYMHIDLLSEEWLRLRLNQRLGDKLWQQFADSYPLSEGVERSLVIHDKEDHLVKWQESEQLAKCWPNAELILTKGLGHRRILLDMATSKKIVEFIDNTVICDTLEKA